MTLGVQVNGKRRAEIEVAASADNAEVEAAALSEADVKRHIDGKTVRKVVVVPGPCREYRGELARMNRTMRIWERLVPIIFLVLSIPALSGCGFTPLYATTDEAGRPALHGVYVAGLNASDDATPILTRAFDRRFARSQGDASYDIYLKVAESASPLAVQIDDSVTRYNYRMGLTYVLSNRSTGEIFKGRADAVASFNVVASQYSTLFAEKATREKAARFLVEDLSATSL